MRYQPVNAQRVDNFGEGRRTGQAAPRQFMPHGYCTPRTTLTSYIVPELGNSSADDARLTNSDLPSLTRYELAVERSALFAGIREARRRVEAFGIRTLVLVPFGSVPFETWAANRLRVIARLTRG